MIAQIKQAGDFMPTIPDTKKIEFGDTMALPDDLMERVFHTTKPRNKIAAKALELRSGEGFMIHFPDWDSPERRQAVRNICQRVRAKRGWSFRVASDSENKAIWVVRVK